MFLVLFHTCKCYINDHVYIIKKNNRKCSCPALLQGGRYNMNMNEEPSSTIIPLDSQQVLEEEKLGFSILQCKSCRSIIGDTSSVQTYNQKTLLITLKSTIYKFTSLFVSSFCVFFPRKIG